MARILIVAPSQPSRTPRLVRNAAALSNAGHEVVVVTPLIETAMIEYDKALVANEQWQYLPVPMLNKHGEIKLSFRLYRKLMFAIASRIPLATAGSNAMVYGAPRLKSIIKNLQADFYIAQQQATLPLVAQIARKKGKPYACDIEDILTESVAEPVRLLSSIEALYLKGAAVISTMSEVAADFLCKSLGIKEKVYALHNCPEIKERDGVTEPSVLSTAKPSIYWFGQTLGSHSLAVELIQANANAGHPFNIALRGRPSQDYLERIHASIKASNSHGMVELLPIVDTSKMVSEAAKHDILFGSQPSEQMFHQLAIGNKVFTGLLAGCALLVTDTIAHRKLKADLQNCMLLVGNNKNDLSNALKALAGDSDGLLRMRKSAWDSGTTRYHWARESRDWVCAINKALKGQQ
jgi:hypothetical protein